MDKVTVTTTTVSNFSDELHNILNKLFHPKRPNAVWCSNITYIGTRRFCISELHYGHKGDKNHSFDNP